MTYIITRMCRDCVDMGCVEVCPVECIYTLRPDSEAALPAQLYIHPTECINCGACEPECPWGAIYEELELPVELAKDAEINANCEVKPQHFDVAKMTRDEHGRLVLKPQPTPQQVAANRARWGLDP
jgi:Fe-S-cluster-containing hydrogenase component 2